MCSIPSISSLSCFQGGKCLVAQKHQKLTLHEIEVTGSDITHNRGGRSHSIGRRSALRSLQVNLDGVGLVVGVLTSLKVEELSVGEKSEVLLHVERLVVSSLLTVDGVEIAKVLRHVGAAATVEVCHFDE